MGTSFVQVDRTAFETFLIGKGFTRGENSGNEITYFRRHKACSDIVIKVLTSIADGEGTAREVGADAIRVIACYENTSGRIFSAGKTWVMHKAKRVHRSAPYNLTVEQKHEIIFERVLDRMRNAYQECTDWLTKHPTFIQHKEKAA